jgi:ribosomal protein S18 acetylase RimI-like enzyme
MEVVNFEPLTDEYVADCLKLYEGNYSSQGVNHIHIRNSAAGVDGFVCSVAVSMDEVIGFSLGVISPFSNCIHVPYTSLSGVVDLEPRSDVGCVSVVCVDNEYQDMFIFEELLEDVINQLEDSDVSIVFEVGSSAPQQIEKAVVDAGLECVFTDDGGKLNGGVRDDPNTVGTLQHNHKLYIKYNTIHLGEIC